MATLCESRETELGVVPDRQASRTNSVKSPALSRSLLTMYFRESRLAAIRENFIDRDR